MEQPRKRVDPGHNRWAGIDRACRCYRRRTGCGKLHTPQPVAHRGTRIYAHLHTCNGCPNALLARLLARFLRPSVARKTAAAAGPWAESMSIAPPGQVAPVAGALHPLSGVK